MAYAAAMTPRDLPEVTVDGTRCVLGLPDTDGPRPAVVVIHELFGQNDDIRDITRRFVDRGYVALAPDLYSDGFKPLCMARTVTDVFRADGIDSARRVEVFRAWLAARDDVMDDRIGVIGFCMGGAVAVMAAAVGDFQAASVNYGQVPKDTSVLHDVCPVIGSYGGEDTRLLGDAARLRETLEEIGVPHEVTVYDGAGHSFLNQALPEVLTKRTASIGYAPEQAAQAWDRIDAFFGTHLQPSGG